LWGALWVPVRDEVDKVISLIKELIQASLRVVHGKEARLVVNYRKQYRDGQKAAVVDHSR
jgi:hypothetical protein